MRKGLGWKRRSIKCCIVVLSPDGIVGEKENKENGESCRVISSSGGEGGMDGKQKHRIGKNATTQRRSCTQWFMICVYPLPSALQTLPSNPRTRRTARNRHDAPFSGNMGKVPAQFHMTTQNGTMLGSSSAPTPMTTSTPPQVET